MEGFVIISSGNYLWKVCELVVGSCNVKEEVFPVGKFTQSKSIRIL